MVHAFTLTVTEATNEEVTLTHNGELLHVPRLLLPTTVAVGDTLTIPTVTPEHFPRAFALFVLNTILADR